jgi:hypothetical protein
VLSVFSIVLVIGSIGSSVNFRLPQIQLSPAPLVHLFSRFCFGEFLFELVDPVLQRR